MSQPGPGPLLAPAATLVMPILTCPCRRGLIMGVWNSHTSVGNILGSLIAGVWVSSAWGLSFIVPGIIIAAVGIICFFFLVECECQLGHSRCPVQD